MKLAVVAEKNIASVNIRKFLRLDSPKQLFKIKDNVLDLDKYEQDLQKLNPKVVAVASTHKSAAKVPMLNAHSTGNWASADLGGKPRKLSIAPALYLAEAVKALRDKKEELKLNYEVGLEVTHHSPTINAPVMFVEVGSSEKEWSDLAACEAVASVISKILSEKDVEKLDVCVGFGGPHYAPQFTRRVLAGKFATGHICPKHHIDSLNEEMILQAIEKTTPKPNFVVLEWKGLKPDQRQKIIAVLEKNKISWEKI